MPAEGACGTGIAAASASTVAESRPPETSTTAFPPASVSAGIVPQKFVQLHLHAHRQAVGENPFGEIGRVHLPVTGRKQHLANPVELVFGEMRAAPFVVRAIADHELDLILFRQMRDIGIQVAARFARSGRLEVHHDTHPRIDTRDIERTAGDGDITRGILGNAAQNIAELHPLPAVESIFRIAVGAAQRTAGQADEYRGTTYRARFTLEGKKYFGDAQPFSGGRCRSTGYG